MARNEGMSSMVVAHKGTVRAMHDKLVDGIELGDQSVIDEALEDLRLIIGVEPRRSWGGKRGARKVYERSEL